MDQASVIENNNSNGHETKGKTVVGAVQLNLGVNEEMWFIVLLQLSNVD